MGKVWLARCVPGGRLRRIWPRRYRLGRLAGGDGDEVWLLEVPLAPGDERLVRWLTRRLRKIERREGGLRLGMPLDLAELMAGVYPDVLAAARRLACREWVRQLAVQHDLCAGLVGLLGLDEAWQDELAAELLARGAELALCGGRAGGLAEKYWRQGLALPVLSARKLVEVCDTVLVLREGVAVRESARVVVWREPRVFVPGEFRDGNLFCAGEAQAFRGC